MGHVLEVSAAYTYQKSGMSPRPHPHPREFYNRNKALSAKFSNNVIGIKDFENHYQSFIVDFLTVELIIFSEIPFTSF